jgi:hypothetical protein
MLRFFTSAFKVKVNILILIFTMINGFFMCNLPKTNRCHQYYYRESESPPQTRLIYLFILDDRFSFIGFPAPSVTHAQHGPFLFTTKSIGRGMGGVPSIPDEETKTDYRALGSFLYMCC